MTGGPVTSPLLARIRYRVVERLLGPYHRVRRMFARRRALSQADAVIEHLRTLKSAQTGRTFCGILLVEHIGDIIACEPVVGWVKREFPGAFIVWIVKHAYTELLSTHPDIDAVVAVDSLAPVGSIIRSGVFDKCFDLHINNRPTGVEGLIHMKTWGDRSIDWMSYSQHGSLLQAFSKAAGIPPFSEAPQMYVSDPTVKSVDSMGLPERFVVVHTTSNVESKDWPPEEWVKLVAYIMDNCGLPVVEIGLQDTISLQHARFRSLCGRLSIMETAEVIRRAQFFIGVDSGPAHMANAWRIPALLLFGLFRNEDNWHPYDGLFAEEARRWIVWHPGPLRELAASDVIRRLEVHALWPGNARDRVVNPKRTASTETTVRLNHDREGTQ